jgi:biopolymer transport protein ExbB
MALYNTGFGLLIAIPAMIFYRHFRALVDSSWSRWSSRR